MIHVLWHTAVDRLAASIVRKMQLTISSARNRVSGVIVLVGIESMPWYASDFGTLWELHTATSAVLGEPLDWN
jgi:hypothetical protein